MLELYFSSDKEAIQFCEQLFQYNKQIELHWKTHAEWGNRLLLDDKNATYNMQDGMVKAMMDVFMIYRLTPMMKDVITKKYYYSTHEEIERILDLTNWIFSGDDADSLDLRNSEDPVEMLQALFYSNMNVLKAIHFDSIIQFRMEPFKKLITDYVGLAIDEFKREEDHQTFLNTIREYVKNRGKSHSTIHVLQGDTFTFFRNNGNHIPKRELRHIIQNEPLYLVGLGSNEWNLSPLIALKPERIIIYGRDPSESKTLTVMNVFDERAKWLPIHQFPFSLNGLHKQM